jgi:hypothetical protein
MEKMCKREIGETPFGNPYEVWYDTDTEEVLATLFQGQTVVLPINPWVDPSRQKKMQIWCIETKESKLEAGFMSRKAAISNVNTWLLGLGYIEVDIH